MGRYQLGPALGAGGAATVYLARLQGPHDFERFFAIKVVHEHLVEDRELATMFLDEAKLAVLLSHPNIVDTYELGHHDSELFIVMEYLAGRPLSQVLARAFKRREPLDYDLVAWIGARAADALSYAHGLKDSDGEPLRIVHRDISPDNLFITYDGQVKVIDFGIAHAEGRLTRTNIGQVKGKFRYMSPEYALGRSFDGTLDFFALAASLYEVALGTAAFDGANSVRIVERLVRGDFADPKKIRPDFPDELASVLKRAMSPHANERFASGRDVCEAFERIAGLTPTAAQSKLAARMAALFADERKRDAENQNELRDWPISAIPEEATPLQHALPPRTDRHALRKATLLGATGAVVAIAVLAFAFRERPRPLPAEPAISRETPALAQSPALGAHAAATSAPVLPLPTASAPQVQAPPAASNPPPKLTKGSRIPGREGASPSAKAAGPDATPAAAKPAKAEPPAERSQVIRDNPFAAEGKPP